MDKIRGGTRTRQSRPATVRYPRTRGDAGRLTDVDVRVEACPVGHDRGVNTEDDRRSLGHRVGVELGLLRPSQGPRSQFARVLTVGADSSHGELIAGLVWSGLLVAVLAINAFSASLWLRLTWPFLALVLLVNPIRAARLLRQRRRAGRGRPPKG